MVKVMCNNEVIHTFLTRESNGGTNHHKATKIQRPTEGNGEVYKGKRVNSYTQAKVKSHIFTQRLPREITQTQIKQPTRSNIDT